MIALTFTLAGLSLYTLQIGAEWLARHHRQARDDYAESFQRTDMIYPKFVR